MPHPRYRVEDGKHCIDVRVGTLGRMFDNRDPAPFRERDLDPDLVDYLVDAADDLAPHGAFRVVFWFSEPVNRDQVEPAYRAHLDYELERVARNRSRQRRTGQAALAIGLTLLVALISLAQALERLDEGQLSDAVREGLLILAWVVMWRPVEALLYEWIPARRQRVLLSRLRDVELDVRRSEARERPADAR